MIMLVVYLLKRKIAIRSVVFWPMLCKPSCELVNNNSVYPWSHMSDAVEKHTQCFLKFCNLLISFLISEYTIMLTGPGRAESYTFDRSDITLWLTFTYLFDLFFLFYLAVPADRFECLMNGKK